MKFKNEISGRRSPNIPHAMRLASLVVNDAWCRYGLAEGFNRASQQKDGDVVGVDVGIVTGSGLQHRDMRCEGVEIGRRLVE